MTLRLWRIKSNISVSDSFEKEKQSWTFENKPQVEKFYANWFDENLVPEV